MNETIKPGLYEHWGNCLDAAILVYLLSEKGYDVRTIKPNILRVGKEIPRRVDNAGKELDLLSVLIPYSQ